MISSSAMRGGALLAGSLVLLGCTATGAPRRWVVEITNDVAIDYVAVISTNLGTHQWLIPSGADSRDLLDGSAFPTSAHLRLFDARSCTLEYEADLPTDSTSIQLDPGFGDQAKLHVDASVKRSLVAGELLSETSRCLATPSARPS